MTGIAFHTHTVTVLRGAATVDRYGDPIDGWSTATETEITGCRVQPAAGPEDTVDRNQITRRWLLFVPPGADIRATDRVRWDGDDYDIDGEIRRWPSVSGRLAHLEADLIRVEG